MPRAFALAVSIVGLLMGGLMLLTSRVVPPPLPPVTVQLMDAASAMTVPAVAAPPPPATVAKPPAALAPPLAPAAAMVPMAEAAPLPELAPMPSPISMATPEPPVPAPPPQAPQRPRPPRHVARPQPVPSELPAEAAAAMTSERDAPAPLSAAPRPNAAPTALADIISGLGPYRAGLHRQIERNMLSDRATEQLGVSGTAVIEATIAPDGRVVSARLARTSGVRAIDDAALGAVQRGGFPAFGPHMPAAPITVSVPIGVEAD